ncbi:MAG: hypothetical protein HC836_16750 [Richelia sp. RM2_1_2]|nr:hypothetical protein [Richelia sp. RM2_1_2]
MKEDERLARIGREQDFYNTCAKILGIDHEYTVPYRRRDRWNTRKLGNGRYPGFGVIRYCSSSYIIVMCKKGTRVFDNEQRVFEFLAQ